MTLREALKIANLDNVYKHINYKDNHDIDKCGRPTLNQTILSYSHVVAELLNKPVVKPGKMPWVVRNEVSYFDKSPYIDVCFYNPDYIAPKKGLKPWGGKNPPPGHYNCNVNKHNKYFAAGFTPWSKIIDTPIINEAKLTIDQMVAEILWEMCFYGWTESNTIEHTNNIMDSIKKDCKKIVKNKNKCKPTKSCSICWGHGLWRDDSNAPMGPMDSADGMPTKACPECGKNPNPLKIK